MGRMTCSINRKHPAYLYAKDVVEGRVLACKKEVLACRRHLCDLERQGAEDFPYVFDESRAERIYHYFSVCRHEKSCLAGDYIRLLPFQYFDFGVPFGWVYKDTGKRRFSKAFDFMARGNAKSTACSVVSLYGLTSDCLYPPGRPDLKRWENAPRVECMAVDKEQAKLVAEPAMKIAAISPEVRKRVEIKKTYITGRQRGGYIKALSKETTNKDGGSPSLVIVDELAAYRDAQRVNTVYGGFGKPMQSLMWIISTAGADAANNPCKQEYDFATKVLTGETEADYYFAMIRELEEGDDPHDDSLWPKPNPMLRYDNEYANGLRKQIRTEHDEAYSKNSADMIREFLIKRLNLWQASSAEKYLSSEELKMLDELAVSPEEFEQLIAGHKTVCGADASKKVDLTATGYVFNLPGGKVGIDAFGFIPSEAVAKHEHSDRVPYRQWIAEGWVNEIEGQVIDMNQIGDHTVQYEAEHGLDVVEVTYDPAYAHQFGIDMQAGRNSYKKKYQVVEIPQTYAQLNEPTEMLKHLILEGRIVWNGNPCLRWCFENAYVVTNTGEQRKLNKRTKDESQRIDLVAAVINALRRFPVLKVDTLKNKIRSGEFGF